jgi:hypothetical protein
MKSEGSVGILRRNMVSAPSSSNLTQIIQYNIQVLGIRTCDCLISNEPMSDSDGPYIAARYAHSASEVSEPVIVNRLLGSDPSSVLACCFVVHVPIKTLLP